MDFGSSSRSEPRDAYTTQLNSSEFQLGGSAALLTVGLADTRGVKATYPFDFWGTVVTSRPEIKTLKDLEGKDLAAAKGTTNYVMFDWFARQAGADTAKFSVVSTATPGLNRKTREGSRHPDRDAQFDCINDHVKAALAAGEPAISVDTKEKELVGNFRNAGASGIRRARRPRFACTTSSFPNWARRALRHL